MHGTLQKPDSNNCQMARRLPRKLEGDIDNTIPRNRMTGAIGSGLKLGSHDGALGGLVETMAETPGDTQNFDCAIGQYADVDGHHTLDMHLPGLLGVLRPRLGDDLGRFDFGGGYGSGRFGRWWRLILPKIDPIGDCLARAAGNA